MHVFRCTSREGGYLYSRISRHFMALKVLENRISGNHNFLLTVGLRLLALSYQIVIAPIKLEKKKQSKATTARTADDALDAFFTADGNWLQVREIIYAYEL